VLYVTEGIEEDDDSDEYEGGDGGNQSANQLIN